MAVTFDLIVRDAGARSLLDDFERRAGNLTPAMTAARDHLHQAAARQFASGAGWKPSRKPAGRTGIKSGALRASLTSTGGASIARIGPAELELGSTLHYAPWFTGGRPRQPRRPVWKSGDAALRRPLRDAIARWLMDGRA